MSTKPSMTSTIHTMGSKESPTSSIIHIKEGTTTQEFCCMTLGVYGAKTEIFIDADAVTLQEWATEFHHLAEKLLRMSIEKENILFEDGLPATDPATYPELEVAAAMEVEF